MQPISLKTHNGNIPSNVEILSWILMSPLQRYTQSNIHKNNNKQICFFGTAVLAAIFYVHSVQPFSVMYIYIYIYIYRNSMVYHSVKSCS